MLFQKFCHPHSFMKLKKKCYLFSTLAKQYSKKFIQKTTYLNCTPHKTLVKLSFSIQLLKHKILLGANYIQITLHKHAMKILNSSTFSIVFSIYYTSHLTIYRNHTSYILIIIIYVMSMWKSYKCSKASQRRAFDLITSTHKKKERFYNFRPKHKTSSSGSISSSTSSISTHTKSSEEMQRNVI
jgi:hypothetical protein